ncbi:hypothetical protein L9F63_027503 [Diploptera punctata]|uniref:C2H2-type domain-containing protein n=1 Tax=Diploptera punctata TaxID=6984 RepID=A0AAD8A7M5_DIPPU|nr:hypothetical protein L9F63_027503 [Diploptera punctata]
MEEEESAVIDEPLKEEINDTHEPNESGMTSIVIANLTGELPSQFTQSRSQTIFVTNTGQIFSDPVPENELQDRQNDALNAILEQLQSSNTYNDNPTRSSISDEVENSNSQTVHNINNDKVMEDSVFSQENNNLSLSDSNTSHQFGPLGEQEQETEESESMSILSEYKPDTPVALNAQQNNGENIINIINAHVNLLEDNEEENSIISDKLKSNKIVEVVDSVTINSQTDKCSDIHNSIFDTFETRSEVTHSEISNSLPEQYPVNTETKDNTEVNNLISTSNEVSNNMNCIINPEDIESDETTAELRLTVDQDMSSAFLELVSVQNFGTSNNTNPNKESDTRDDGEGKSSLQDDIQLLRSFDLDSVPEEPNLLPDDNSKILDIGPPYNCDICNKEFHKADYLYRHLRKHTGEFTCVSCLAVFARKESLVNHLCLADSSTVAENASFTCPFCQKKFLLKKLFKRHMAKHTGEWKCDTCERRYFIKDNSCLFSRCIKKPNPAYRCQICKKEFLRHQLLVQNTWFFHNSESTLFYLW